MAYDEQLAARARRLVEDLPDVSERKMFGGLAFLVHGHLAVAASSDGGLMLRVDPAESDALVEEPGASRMVMRGREMDGWLRVRADVLEGEDALRRWVDLGVRYAAALPAK